MYDMAQAGAVAFGDGIHCIQSAGILLKALQYIVAINGTLIQLPDDKSIQPQGLVHEGIVSTRLGLPGKPAIAEEVMIARDIELVKYCNSKIHFTGISTQKSLELVTKAKAEGLAVSCSVAPYHLYFCDEDVVNYDTNLKVNPPLRPRADMMALREGLKSGLIDCVASHHLPQHIDNKMCEFEYAKSGMAGLETLAGAVLPFCRDISSFVDMLAARSRKIMGLPAPLLEEGAEARLTLFVPDTEYVFDVANSRSKSANTAFHGKKLSVKVVGTVCGESVYLN